MIFYYFLFNHLFLWDSLTKTLSNESQHLYHGGAATTTTSSLASEISSLEDPTYKVGKISVEERKRKIHRYLKKRNERNFSKKIKVIIFVYIYISKFNKVFCNIYNHVHIHI